MFLHFSELRSKTYYLKVQNLVGDEHAEALREPPSTRERIATARYYAAPVLFHRRQCLNDALFSRRPFPT